MAEKFLPLFPEQASTVAASVDGLYFFLIAMSAVFAVGIALTLIVFAVRYRRRSEDETPEAIHGSLVLELIWTVIPLGLSMVVFVWGASVYFTMTQPPANAEEVLVVARQWMWKFQHADGRREINELHIPVGTPIKLTMSSEDVIHSFFVPAFRVKQDVLPRRTRTVWFEATRPGTYHLFCAEYCGTEHSRMGGWVTVLEPSQYEEWLAGVPPAESPTAAGAALYAQLGCQTCHKPDGSGLGPKLAGLIGHSVELQNGQSLLANEDYVRESILDPQSKLVKGFLPVMPTFQGRVSEEQMLQLIAYIKSLG